MGVYRDEVERGAVFLDEQWPGWRDRLDVDKLDLGSCFQCVIGQLVGSFAERHVLGLNMVSCGDSERYGFVLTDDEEFAIQDEAERELASSETYAGLTAEWREYIRETRTAVTA